MINEGIARLITELQDSRYFGTVELRFEAGKITYIKKTETLKPEDLTHRENQGTNERNQYR